MRRSPLLALVAVFALVGPARPAARADVAADAVQRARGFVGKQDYRSARQILERALEGSPRDAAANELLGFCLMKLFAFDEACEAFARGDPSDRYHEINLGFCLRKSGRLMEARDAFRRAQRTLSPQDSWSAYCADQLAELDPVARSRVVLCMAQADDFVVVGIGGKPVGRARAGGELALPLDAHLRGGTTKVHVLAVNTTGTWAYRMRLYIGGQSVWAAGAGYAAKGAGAFENDQTVGIVADATLEVEGTAESAKLAGTAGPADFGAIAAQMHEAEKLWKDGDFPGAIKIFETGGREHPSLDWFHLRLAESCDEIALAITETGPEAATKRERLKKAAGAARDKWIDVRKKVAALAGDDAGAYASLAQAASSVGKLAEAESAFRKSLELDPNRVETMVGLADALVKQGKGGEAKSWAEKAIERTPHWSYAHFMLGDALLEMGDTPGALAAYQKAVDLDPTQGEWMYGKIAVAMNRGGANSAAISAAIKAAAKAAKNAGAQRELGEALMRGLKWEDATAAFRAATTVDPKVPGVQPLAGLCFELAGKTKPAVAAYEKGANDGDEALKELAKRRLPRVKFFAEPPGRVPRAAGATDFQAAGGAGKAKAQAALDALKAVRPVLAEGLKALPPLRDGDVSADDATAVERISELAQRARARDELRRGIDLVEREVPKRRGPPKVDGDLGEWSKAERLAADPPGDQARGSPAGADLAEFYAAIHGDQLYLAWRAHGGAKVSGACGYWANIYPAKRGVPWLAVGICADDPYAIRFPPGGGREQLKGSQSGIEYDVGSDGVEARVPLSLLGGERRLDAEAYTWAPAGRLDPMAEGRPPVRVEDGYSPSLLALFHIATDVTLEPDDRPAVAIALASGDYYALGDASLDALVREDDRRMLRFSRMLKVWQRAMGQATLDSLPLGALLFWANRGMQWRGTDAAEYRRDTISPATLEAMFQFAQKKGWRGRSAGEIVEHAEKYLIDPKRWQYTSYEMVARGVRARAGESVTLSESEKKDLNKFVRQVAIDGQKVTTDGTFNPDLQFDYLLATDALLGHCGNLAQTVVDFARAVGVPATIIQGKEEQSRLYQNPHAFPVYYDAAAKVWRSFQGRKYKGIRPLTLYFFLPPLAPPDLAKATGGGSYWYPVYTTYEEAGPMFGNGYDPEWVKAWLEGLASSK